MRKGVQRFLTLVAIYAVALHTILLGLAPVFAAPAFDPFSVICHSAAGGAAPVEQAPANSIPSHACDHCIACNAMAPPGPLDKLVVEQLAPARLLQILRPLLSILEDGVTFNLKHARGPPHFV